MEDEKVEKEAGEVSEEIKKSAKEAAEKVAEEAAEKVEKVAEEIGKAADEASEVIEKKGEEAAEEIEKTIEETDVFAVEEDSPVDDKTVEEIDNGDILGVDAVLVKVERDDDEIVPKGDTLIKSGDLVKIHSPDKIKKKTREAFRK